MFNPLNLISKIIKGSNQKELDRIQKIVKNINLFEKDVEKLDKTEFLKKTNEFIKQILIKKLSVKNLIIGSDFKFGKDRMGDLFLLKEKRPSLLNQ